MKKYYFLTTLVILIIPQISHASWWNPATWFNSPTVYNEANVNNTIESTKTPPKPIVIEKEVIKEVPVEKIVEKIVEKQVPVEKIVTKTITVDNPQTMSQLKIITEKYNLLKVNYDAVVNKLSMCSTNSTETYSPVAPAPAIAPSVVCQALLTEIEDKKSYAQMIINGESEQLSPYKGLLMVENRSVPDIIANIKKKNSDAVNSLIAETSLLREKFDLLCK